MSRDAPAAGMFATGFDGLRTGDRHVGPLRSISQADVDVFAALTGDRHPLHTDPEWAAASGPFGGPVVHGLLIVSCAVGSLPLDPDRVIALRRVRDVVFKRPLPVEDGIAVECRIVELKAIDAGAGLVTCECRIVDRDRRLIVRAALEILWRREAGPADELAAVLVEGERTRVLI